VQYMKFFYMILNSESGVEKLRAKSLAPCFSKKDVSTNTF